jgi:urease accessory protein
MKAGVHIEIASAGNISFLKNAFAETPFKIANITEDKKNDPLHLVLMSSSPGILDGDEYHISFNLAAGTSLQLHTQAYQRLFQMNNYATQQLKVDVGADASFCYLPHPTVPHRQSSFISTNNFYLQKGSRLVFGEVLTCGRKLNDEQFLFSKYQSISNIYVEKRLAVKENLLMMPGLINVHAMGQLEGYSHQASFIYLQEDTNMQALQATLLVFLSAEKDMDAGISILPVNGLIIRLLGYGAEQLYDCLQKINAMLPFSAPKSIAYEC